MLMMWMCSDVRISSKLWNATAGSPFSNSPPYADVTTGRMSRHQRHSLPWNTPAEPGPDFSQREDPPLSTMRASLVGSVMSV